MFKRVLLFLLALVGSAGVFSTVALTQSHHPKPPHHFIGLHNRAEARLIEIHFGKKALWAWNQAAHKFESTVNFPPSPRSTLYATRANALAAHALPRPKRPTLHSTPTKAGTTGSAATSTSVPSSTSNSSTSSSSSSSTSTSTSTTTTTTTAPPPQPQATSSGAIGGNSKTNCLYMNDPSGQYSQGLLSSYESTTGTTYNCVELFSDADPTWQDWVNPWPFGPNDGWDAWLAQSPTHQIVLGQQLIPDQECTSVCSNPLAWESACAAGQYDTYAAQLARNLVAAGAGNTVIRLGKEFNGKWENDWIGTTTQEEQAWAQCFDNEVSSMRAVPGAHFLFDWNPAACDAGYTLGASYPGNSYVDIIGIDAYDEDCTNLKSSGQEGFTALLNGGGAVSTASIIAFAGSQGKPISFPEWGEDQGFGDDPGYINGIAQIVKSDNVAYQSYFDCGCDGITPLGSSIPQSTSAYTAAFG